tara:strand:- start:21843 stop:22760 length:918 start_codon:yes stop_codon:yes gene_type:complete
VGLFFIFLSINITSADDRRMILFSIKNADYKFALVSIIFGILSHLSRAYRWNFLLSPLGYKPKFINSVFSVFIGYLANLGVPRSGELLRASALSNYEKIPFEKAFGTIVAERAVDLIMLLSFICLALFLQYDLLFSLINKEQNNASELVACFLILILILAFLRHLFYNSKSTLIKKLKLIIKGFWEGVISITKIQNKIPFVLHTVFIWTMYFLMFTVIKWTIPETHNLPFQILLLAFVAGSLTISATNGGIGIFPFSIAVILNAFGYGNDDGLTFGWILWTSQTFMIILLGAISFLAIPFFNRKS